jgi:Domain of unknown function (DUF4189)
MNMIRGLSALVLLCFAELAAAQCGPQNPSCATEQALHDLYGSPPPPPPAGWSTRWGAVAFNSQAFGSAANMPSKRKAKKVAIDQCKASGGGKTCSVDVLTYYNSCIALATTDSSSGWASAPDVGKAEKDSLDYCGKTGQGCKVYYSACSLPVRTR